MGDRSFLLFLESEPSDSSAQLCPFWESGTSYSAPRRSSGPTPARGGPRGMPSPFLCVIPFYFFIFFRTWSKSLRSPSLSLTLPGALRKPQAFISRFRLHDRFPPWRPDSWTWRYRGTPTRVLSPEAQRPCHCPPPPALSPHRTGS